ncbi:MAG: D-aminoacylase [Actinobacteria bacterium]|nr:MAG: D-aminoacylase [Actinomycetota bacterium]
MRHDLVIRGGTVIDGTGGPRVTADVAIDGAVIVDVGVDVGNGRRTIEADGLLVTPGFVDVHTHYDAQVAWDPYVTPTSWHGVTTAIMGNCGVGFAPVKAEHREWLISLMEGVEDIPAAVLGAGLPWGWETYGDYLDVLDRDPRAIDIGGMVTHAATRVYVMGERGADHRNQPTDNEVEQMSKIVAAALDAGALGFSTSRSRNHKTRDGDPIASLNASGRELLGCADGLRRQRRGLIEIAADFVDNDIESEFALFRSLAARSGRPVSLPMTPQHHQPERHRQLLDLMAQAGAEGLQFTAQVPIRPVGVMIGLENRLHPFYATLTYQSIAAHPLAERLSLLRQPEYRSRIVAEARALPVVPDMSLTFALGEPLDYEPDDSQSVTARARDLGVDPLELAYDLLTAGDGSSFLYRPANSYGSGNFDALRELLSSPLTVPGLGDGGAHCTLISDASNPTYMLTHWGRDRSRGERLPVELLVKWHAHDTASLFGLDDRGVVAPGRKADVNVIDFDALRVCPPQMAYDFPAGGKRLVQRAVGYRATVVSGEVTYLDGEPTGVLPGRVVRSR